MVFISRNNCINVELLLYPRRYGINPIHIDVNFVEASRLIADSCIIVDATPTLCLVIDL